MVIGCVANLTPQKGLEAFVSVCELVARERSDVTFCLFGRPMETHQDYASRIRSMVSGLAGAGRFRILDVGDEVPRYVRALDVFLATATPRSEGISTTVLEAMASAVTVVSTDVGSIREAVTHGVNGFLVSANEPAATADYVLRLSRNRALRETMSAAARERAVEDFDVEHCADVHESAFRAALLRGQC